MPKLVSLRFGRYDYGAFTGLMSYAECSIIVPVLLVSIAQGLGFPLDDGGKGAGGALQLGRSFAIVAAMLFCGFFAGRFGSRRTLGWSTLIMAAGIMLAALAQDYRILFLAFTIAGLGEGVVEGLATPFVQELHPDDPGRYINFTHGFWSVGVLGTVLIAGFLADRGVSWRVLLMLCSVMALVPAFILLGRSRGTPLRESRKGVKPHIVAARAVKILKMPRFWLFFCAMFLAGGGEFGLTFWCANFIQLEFGSATFAGAIGTAIFSAGMLSGRMGSGILVPQNKLPHLILATTFSGAVVALFIPGLQSLGWLYFVLFFAGLTAAPYWPSLQCYCAATTPKADETMLYILLSCCGVPGSGVFCYLLGALGDRYGLRNSFYLIPAAYLAVGIIIGIDMYRRKRLHRQKAAK